MALTGVFPGNSNLVVESAPLELVRCCASEGRDACGLVQLRHSVDPQLLYGTGYGYRSGLNRWMVEHLREIARNLQDMVCLCGATL